MKSYQERTAFNVGALGLYEFKRMSFDHSNSPATYQRLMEDCLDDLNLKSCFIFLVDHIVFSKTLDEHLLRLQMANNKIMMIFKVFGKEMLKVERNLNQQKFVKS